MKPAAPLKIFQLGSVWPHPPSNLGTNQEPAASQPISSALLMYCFFFFPVVCVFPEWSRGDGGPEGEIPQFVHQVAPSWLTVDSAPSPPAHWALGPTPTPHCPGPLMRGRFECKAAAVPRSFSLVVSVGALPVWRPLWVVASITLLLLGSLEERLERHTQQQRDDGWMYDGGKDECMVEGWMMDGRSCTLM